MSLKPTRSKSTPRVKINDTINYYETNTTAPITAPTKQQFTLHTINIERKPGQTLGFYITQDSLYNKFTCTHEQCILINKINDDCLFKIKNLIQLNDEIIKINEKLLKNMSLDAVVLLLASHSSVQMTVKRRQSNSHVPNKMFAQVKLLDQQEQLVDRYSTINRKKNYDIINGKVDQTYSHKLFYVNYDEYGGDEHDGDNNDKKAKCIDLNDAAASTCDSASMSTNNVNRKLVNRLNSSFDDYDNYNRTHCSRDETKFHESSLNEKKFEDMVLYSSQEYNTWLRKKLQKMNKKILKPTITTQNEQFKSQVIHLPNPSINYTNNKASSIYTINDNDHQLYQSQQQQPQQPTGISNLTHLSIHVHHAYKRNAGVEMANKHHYYAILRFNQQPISRTCLCLENDNDKNLIELNTNCIYTKIIWNEQFLLNLSELQSTPNTQNSSFDVIICELIENAVNVNQKYFLKQFHIVDFLHLSQTIEHKIRLNNLEFSNLNDNKNKNFIILYLTLKFYSNYSYIEHLYIKKTNSKLFDHQIVTSKQPTLGVNCGSVPVKIDLILRKCINEIEIRGLNEPFIYQLCAYTGDIKWTLLQLERDYLSILQIVPDIHVISNVFKELLRELPEPLFNDKILFTKLITLWKDYKYSSNFHVNDSAIIDTIEYLPTANKALFILLLKHLQLVSTHVNTNCMCKTALAKQFASLIFYKLDKYSVLLNEELLEHLLNKWQLNYSLRVNPKSDTSNSL